MSSGPIPDARTRALIRFEAQLPLLKLLVGQLMHGFPWGALPLVVTGAAALWRASLAYDEQHDPSFGTLAETAIHGALLAHLHAGQAAGGLPHDLEAHRERLERLAEELDHARTTAVQPYAASLAAPGALVSALEDFPVAPASEEGRLLHALGELLSRRWPLILAIVLATEAMVSVLVLRSPKIYKATTTLNTGIASGQPVSGAAIDWFKAGALMGNLTETLKSRTLLERTIARLDLPTTPEKLAKQIDVEKVGQTDMMRVSATSASAEAAARLANAHTDEFLRFYRASQGADAKQADAFIAQQVRSSAERLHQAEQRLRAFKSQNLPEAQSTFATQLADLRAQQGEAERALGAARSGLAAVERELVGLRSDPLFARTVRDSAEVDAAGDRLKTLQQNLADAEGLYGADSAVVRHLKAQIAKASGTVRATTAKVAASDPAHADVVARRIALKVEIAQQEAKLKALGLAIAKLEPQARSASISEVTYKELQREVAVREAEYQRLSERAGQTRLAASGASLLPITVVDPAEPPRRPESSKALVKLALGALLASILGMVLAFVLEVRARGRREASLVEAAAEAP